MLSLLSRLLDLFNIKQYRKPILNLQTKTMYPKTALVKNNSLFKGSFSSFKKFSVLDKFNRNSLAYRMTKYDPSKELEVKNHNKK